MQTSAALLIQQADGSTSEVTLRTEQVVLGRAPECDIVLEGRLISRQHATITLRQLKRYKGSVCATQIAGECAGQLLALVEDFDGDGNIDLLRTKTGSSRGKNYQPQLWRNEGGKFVASDAVPAIAISVGAAVAANRGLQPRYVDVGEVRAILRQQGAFLTDDAAVAAAGQAIAAE